MSDRDMIPEEVAEAEVALADLSQYTARELAGMNEQLGYLRTQAISLGMPTDQIDQLKLRVTGAIPNADSNPNPGPRGKERIYPTSIPAPAPPREPAPPSKDTQDSVKELFE